MPKRGKNQEEAGVGAGSCRRVVILVLPGVDLLDVAGPSEAFFVVDRSPNRVADPPRYCIELVRVGPEREVVTACGIRMIVEQELDSIREPIDTLLIPAAEIGFSLAPDSPICDAIRRAIPRCRRVASICAGSFILAATGILNGRRATTHWMAAPEFARKYPQIRVDSDAIYVQDGMFFSSAGSTAGMDLALALIEADHGREMALFVARQLVMFVRRPGGQSQFSELLADQSSNRRPLSDLIAWIANHLRSPLTVEQLAERSHMSVRNFTRVFTREIGYTPARYVERLRVDAARRLLETDSDSPLEQIALGCGFGSADSMRRSFLRVLRTSASDYRNRFRHNRFSP
ncbi:GlxA family transcriptional regulator [Tuwongella immobilis]|uniref:HTH araC/xylS-type domain-containing protein n=1 Tax=Tuwongella immobilis TaxID=692036 RepID=A0A6C2YQ64_9BACT|nr:GlxA family transcriptional regulator [Tuwongella immobilis]VIP03778.1 family transcriptional regulator : Transcriptional regulator containing an amidase domain and an AraC-type DNA-binding HTH domain OS=Singulisphaera acidiphila (strain ATCC BAA-1392 / DSM 18658 / VKM B-2454 / MOB10) GN=Sinac_4113 PE=4 SV=1: DUF4066: HTH_18 [Tuwongella immobilis]VTS04924.1 family transcriptional regulator : Transcriptional regulator containing an amidase domain and an AraC-type DNA-binding HTH domain OS=Singu